MRRGCGRTSVPPFKARAVWLQSCILFNLFPISFSSLSPVRRLYRVRGLLQCRCCPNSLVSSLVAMLHSSQALPHLLPSLCPVRRFYRVRGFLQCRGCPNSLMVMRSLRSTGAVPIAHCALVRRGCGRTSVPPFKAGSVWLQCCILFNIFPISFPPSLGLVLPPLSGPSLVSPFPSLSLPYLLLTWQGNGTQGC